MPDISIQFHALPDEILNFVRLIVTDFDLQVVALQFRPFGAIRLSESQLDGYFSDDSSYKRLHFTLGEPVLPAANELDFGDKNPNSLRLDAGPFNRGGLRESWLSARTENPGAIATWRKIAKRLKNITSQGATAINPDTGATGPVKGHRFSEGARRKQVEGTPMLSLTGLVMKPGLPPGE